MTDAGATSVPPAPAPRAHPLRDRPLRRLAQLYAGLVLYGVSLALMVQAGLGLDPWDVFHQGIAQHTPFTLGQVVIAVGAVVLLLWIPLRERPGIGTVSNVVVIGLVVDAALAVIPAPDNLVVRVAALAAGVVLNAVATASYIGAGLGTGPRDGLMTGWARRSGASIRRVRTLIELSVLAVGWLLGGTVGVGTVAYAVAIGPLVHLLLPVFDLDGTSGPHGPQAARPHPASGPLMPLAE